MFHKIRRGFDWFTRDKTGHLQIFQFPNLPLTAWFACMIVNLATKGTLQSGLSQLSLIFLSIWAYLEITSGLSYFRRMLGVIIACVIVFNLFA